MHSSTDTSKDSSAEHASRGLKAAAIGAIFFLHFPILIIALYAFTTEERTYQFPPPGLTLNWFGTILQRQDFWKALQLSLQVASVAMVIALIFGALIAAAIYRN